MTVKNSYSLANRVQERFVTSITERLDEWLRGWEFIDNHDFSDEEKILVVDKELAVKEKLRDGWSRLRCELYVMLND
uniref:Uncharacterized protein n=1 Tax=Rhizophagus irregularis (strain DAOM 181602 / DAOM 197198 / MUCL 43194) TaxID=747089 RepID=U9TEY5_RHIID